MRIITKVYPVFSLRELHELAQEEGYFPGMHAGQARNACSRAMATLAEFTASDELELGMFEEDLATEGFTNAKINFSGFYSQGDGASFTCDWINLEAFLDRYPLPATVRHARHVRRAAEAAGFCARFVRDSHRYAHEHTVRLESDMRTDGCRTEALLEELEEHIEETGRERMQDVYSDLRAEYESRQEEEYLLDMADANEYEFTSAGTLCSG
jgi:hypothetical protein